MLRRPSPQPPIHIHLGLPPRGRGGRGQAMRARATGRQRRNTAPRRNNPGRWTQWFVAASGSVTGASPAGVLETVILHPGSFPGSPYATTCAQYTHRTEHHMQLKIYCTAASTTGCRFGATIIADPYMTTQPSLPMIWARLASGEGTMISASGNTTGSSISSIRGSTTRLSNSNIPPSENTLGYASGKLVIALLDPPIGLSTNTNLQWTALLRLNMSHHNPTPGYMNYEQSSTTTLPPQQNVTNVTGDMPVVNLANSSVHDGGRYWDTTGGMVPPPAQGVIYTMSIEAKNWELEGSGSGTPMYFVALPPDSTGGNANLIAGYDSFQNALAAAQNRYSSIPNGHQYFISRTGTATWANRFWGPSTGSMALFMYYVAGTQPPTARSAMVASTGMQTTPGRMVFQQQALSYGQPPPTMSVPCDPSWLAHSQPPSGELAWRHQIDALTSTMHAPTDSATCPQNFQRSLPSYSSRFTPMQQRVEGQQLHLQPSPLTTTHPQPPLSVEQTLQSQIQFLQQQLQQLNCSGSCPTLNPCYETSGSELDYGAEDDDDFAEPDDTAVEEFLTELREVIPE